MATRMPIARCSSRRMYQCCGGSGLDPRSAPCGSWSGQESHGSSVMAIASSLEAAAWRNRARGRRAEILAAAGGEAAVARERAGETADGRRFVAVAVVARPEQDRQLRAGDARRRYVVALVGADGEPADRTDAADRDRPSGAVGRDRDSARVARRLVERDLDRVALLDRARRSTGVCDDGVDRDEETHRRERN